MRGIGRALLLSLLTSIAALLSSCSARQAAQVRPGMAPVVTPAPAAPLAAAHAATPAPTVKLQPPLPAATVTASASLTPTPTNTPLQLHHGEADEEVPMQMSITLADEMRQAGKYVELYTYPNNEHNIYASFDLAMQRSVAFMDKWVKAR